MNCRPSDDAALYDAIPTWQPHPNVVEVLEAIAPHVPLVILSNSMVDLIPASVAHLKAKFHAVYTAEEARAIHYGESDARTIHGETTIDEARALHDEGVSVAPLPLPFVPPQAKN